MRRLSAEPDLIEVQGVPGRRLGPGQGNVTGGVSDEMLPLRGGEFPPDLRRQTCGENPVGNLLALENNGPAADDAPRSCD